MADQKLSELTELATAPANDDEVYIRDVSEAAAAESKRITITNLLAGAGGATLTVAETEVFSGSVTTANTFQDLDINAVVGSNHALVYCVVTRGVNDPAFFVARLNGETVEWRDYLTRFDMTTLDHRYTFIVPTDNAGIFEWKTAVQQAVVISVIAFIA